MLDYITQYRSGESGYYTERKRGTVDVFFDNKRYIYRKPIDLMGFKNELREAFAGRGMPPAKVSGEYPVYHIDTRA
jgi:hypothetical protein